MNMIWRRIHLTIVTARREPEPTNQDNQPFSPSATLTARKLTAIAFCLFFKKNPVTYIYSAFASHFRICPCFTFKKRRLFGAFKGLAQVVGAHERKKKKVFDFAFKQSKTGPAASHASNICLSILQKYSHTLSPVLSSTGVSDSFHEIIRF
jgi:hypothetical protein